jgi:hypothetical protein
MALEPGERIDLKRAIAHTLGQQEWGDIDLTLEEFSCLTMDQWDGDRESYVLAMLRPCDDEVLMQLDGYLHPKAGAPAQPQPRAFADPASPWAGSGIRLFLSHEHQHADHAGRIRYALARRSVDAFVAHDSIEPTEEWKRVILNALHSCDACVAFLTPEFPRSKWCDQEVGFCIARDRMVIPVDHGQTPYGFLGDFQSLKVRDSQGEDDVALAVFELLVRKPQTRDLMAQALVQRWRDTASYDQARENYGFLRRIPDGVWTQAMVDDIWEAHERNGQLRDASINWQDSRHALEALFESVPLTGSPPDDDIPF